MTGASFPLFMRWAHIVVELFASPGDTAKAKSPSAVWTEKDAGQRKQSCPLRRSPCIALHHFLDSIEHRTGNNGWVIVLHNDPISWIPIPHCFYLVVWSASFPLNQNTDVEWVEQDPPNSSNAPFAIP